MPQPNILLILTDQQRYDTIAALGNTVIKTPALDRLCAQGTAFTRCYTPSPVCVPARAAVASGLPPHLNGCVDNGAPIDPKLPSFINHLADSGYQTHGAGKMHFTPAKRLWGFEERDISEEGAGEDDDFVRFIRENGYDHVDDPHGVRSEMYYLPQPSQLPERLHHTRWVADKSIEFLEQRDKSKPFFLQANWIKPHPPFENPTPWNKLYRAAEMDEPFLPPQLEHLQTYWNKVQNRYKYYDQGYDAIRARAIKAAYYGCISYIDYHVGRLLEVLGDEIDNTLILFSADHGELLGDYGCVGKRSMLDAAARVPMLVRYPQKFKAGWRCATPTTLLDLWPTMLSAAGVKSPKVCKEGEDLAEVAEADNNDGGRVVYSQFQQNGYALYMAASRTGKYIYSAPDNKEWYFDLEHDQYESRNGWGNPMAGDKPARLKQSLIERFKRDGYNKPLEGDDWKKFPKRDIPEAPDYGLLFQDGNAQGLQDKIDALGQGYRKNVTVTGPGASALLQTEK